MPAGARGGLRTSLGQNLTFYDRELKHPYSQRWSFGFQHWLPGGWLVDSSYLGNHTIRLAAPRSLNSVPASALSTSPVRDQATIDSLSASFASPFQGLNPIYGSTISRGEMLRPYPQFGSISVERADGYSWYHALETRIEKKFSQGYTFQLSHTWSKLMTAVEYLNPTDARPAGTIGVFDRPQRVAASGIWELPPGRGLPPVLAAVARGWQLGALVAIQSGPPLGFDNIVFNGNIKDLPLPAGQRGADRWFNTAAGFERDFSRQLAYNLRTFPLRLSGLRGDGLSRWDFSLIRNLALRDKLTFQLRAEVFNAWNHASFSTPNVSPTSTAFGTITSTATESRQWQFSGRMKF
jgi:hypothetical protein